jgi:hypothetical protein
LDSGDEQLYKFQRTFLGLENFLFVVFRLFLGNPVASDNMRPEFK